MNLFFPKRLAILLMLLGTLLGGAANSAAYQGKDKKPPTTPTNFRVTALSPGSVTFAWNPSTDDSGRFKYVIVSGALGSWDVAQTATTATIRPESIPYTWMTYDFYIYAIDIAGNKSKNSNTVSVRFPNDVTPPSKPVVNLTSKGPTHISVSYNSTDDGTGLRYEVRLDGVIRYSSIPDTSATLYFLNAGQTYTVTVRARDNGGNWSPYSDPLVVTTPMPDPNDHTPPTPPLGVSEFLFNSDGELWLTWSNATDNVTPSNLIRYYLRHNGVVTDATVNLNRFIIYLEMGVVNTLEIVAVDEAGNVSTPVTLVYDMR